MDGDSIINQFLDSEVRGGGGDDGSGSKIKVETKKAGASGATGERKQNVHFKLASVLLQNFSSFLFDIRGWSTGDGTGKFTHKHFNFMFKTNPREPTSDLYKTRLRLFGKVFENYIQPSRLKTLIDAMSLYAKRLQFIITNLRRGGAPTQLVEEVSDWRKTFILMQASRTWPLLLTIKDFNLFLVSLLQNYDSLSNVNQTSRPRSIQNRQLDAAMIKTEIDKYLIFTSL